MRKKLGNNLLTNLSDASDTLENKSKKSNFKNNNK